MAFIDNSERVKTTLKKKGIAWLLEVCGELQSQTEKNSRVDKGETKGSWKFAVDEFKLEGYVGSNYQNAIWEEFGTGEYALNGDGRKTPWYVHVDSYTGKKKPTYNGEVVIVYGKNGEKYYKTNGKKPGRPFFKAYTSLKNGMKRRAEEIFGEMNWDE